MEDLDEMGGVVVSGLQIRTVKLLYDDWKEGTVPFQDAFR